MRENYSLFNTDYCNCLFKVVGKELTDDINYDLGSIMDSRDCRQWQ